MDFKWNVSNLYQHSLHSVLKCGSTWRESQSILNGMEGALSRHQVKQRFFSWRPPDVSAAGMLFLKAAAITKLLLRRPDDGHVFPHKEDLLNCDLVPVRSGSVSTTDTKETCRCDHTVSLGRSHTAEHWHETHTTEDRNNFSTVGASFCILQRKLCWQ